MKTKTIKPQLFIGFAIWMDSEIGLATIQPNTATRAIILDGLAAPIILLFAVV